MTKEELRVGLRVRTRTEFAGVVKGSPGVVVERTNSFPDERATSVAIQWNRFDGDEQVDWFAYEELKYLDVAE